MAAAEVTDVGLAFKGGSRKTSSVILGIMGISNDTPRCNTAILGKLVPLLAHGSPAVRPVLSVYPLSYCASLKPTSTSMRAIGETTIFAPIYFGRLEVIKSQKPL